jgi:SAM-dependent methyltransferase
MTSRRLSLDVPDPYASGRFPFSAQTHAVGQRLLFDAATVLMLLDCRPGDRVLDIGAGAGFSSELLARFGYDVVAVDLDQRMLSCNRNRMTFDRSRIDGSVRVIQGAAEDLPCAAAVFDGIVGLNVMHHVRDLPRAAKELARVLRPQGRAVFSEPGIEHLQSRETRRAIEEHGEGDRPFDYLGFAALAETSGFSPAFTSATTYPPLAMLPVKDVEIYASGQHPDPLLTPRGVAHTLRHHHPFLVLIREGVRPETSRHFISLEAEIGVGDTPVAARPGDRFTVRVHARNTGNARWLAAQSIRGGFVTFGCKLLAADGRLVDDRLGRTTLEADVPPGGTATADLEIDLPSDLTPAEYMLAFEMVNEFVCWFSDLRPETTVSRRLRVT